MRGGKRETCDIEGAYFILQPFHIAKTKMQWTSSSHVSAQHLEFGETLPLIILLLIVIAIEEHKDHSKGASGPTSAAVS